MDYLRKHDQNIANNTNELMEHQRKLEWQETIINGMKKRLGEIQKSGKDTAAKLSLAGMVATSQDSEADIRQNQIIENLEK